MCTKLQTLTDFEYFLSNFQSWLGLAVVAYDYSPGLTSSHISQNKTASTLKLVFGVSFLRVGVVDDLKDRLKKKTNITYDNKLFIEYNQNIWILSMMVPKVSIPRKGSFE